MVLMVRWIYISFLDTDKESQIASKVWWEVLDFWQFTQIQETSISK